MSNKEAAMRLRAKKTESQMSPLNTYIPKEDKELLLSIQKKHGFKNISLAVSLVCRSYQKKLFTRVNKNLS